MRANPENKESCDCVPGDCAEVECWISWFSWAEALVPEPWTKGAH
jgi:hypothetical protein